MTGSRIAFFVFTGLGNLAIGAWCLLDPLTPFAVPMGYVNFVAGITLVGVVCFDGLTMLDQPLPGDLVLSRATGTTWEVCGIRERGGIEVRLFNGDRIPKQPSNLVSSPPWFWFMFERKKT